MLTFVIVNFLIMFTDFGHIHSVILIRSSEKPSKQIVIKTGLYEFCSAGPITIMSQKRLVQIGIISIGFPDCSFIQYPSVVARISGARNWILQNSDAAQWQCD